MVTETTTCNDCTQLRWHAETVNHFRRHSAKLGMLTQGHVYVGVMPSYHCTV